MNRTETRKVRRGRIFPEIQWSQAKFKPELLKTHYNWFMAIEPESGEYFIHQDEEVATQMARQKHRSAKIVMFAINETGVSGKI